jgi:hypothetical protein
MCVFSEHISIQVVLCWSSIPDAAPGSALWSTCAKKMHCAPCLRLISMCKLCASAKAAAKGNSAYDAKAQSNGQPMYPSNCLVMLACLGLLYLFTSFDGLSPMQHTLQIGFDNNERAKILGCCILSHATPGSVTDQKSATATSHLTGDGLAPLPPLPQLSNRRS